MGLANRRNVWPSRELQIPEPGESIRYLLHQRFPLFLLNREDLHEAVNLVYQKTNQKY